MIKKERGTTQFTTLVPQTEERLEEAPEAQEYSEAVVRRYLAGPNRARWYVNADVFDLLQRDMERISNLIEEHEAILATHDAILTNHEQRLIALEPEKKKERIIQDLKAASDKNVELLRELFNLPETKKRSTKEVLKGIRGLLSEYSEENFDAVELLHSLRDR